MRIFRFTLTFLFAFLSLTIPLTQTVSAQQDPHRTEHLKPWPQINFEDDPQIDMVVKNDHCLIAESVNIPNRNRFRIYFNAEFPTGSSQKTDRMKKAVKACEQLVRQYYTKAHVIAFYGTDNYEKNLQSSEKPMSEPNSPEREQANDYWTGKKRGVTGSNLTTSVLANVPFDQAQNYVPPKVEIEAVPAPDSIQALDPEDLSDRASLEFRKSFFIIAEIYDSAASSNEEADQRDEELRKSMRAGFRRIHSRVDSLGREHQRTRDSTQRALELARDARRKAQEAKDDQENFWSQGALSAGYRKELGLNMGQIRFEVGNPITLHFSTGGYPDDLVTELCKGGAGGSHVLFWEIGGRYSYNFRQWTLGAGLSTNMTYFSLDDTEDKGKTDESAKKNLKVWSLGPNATVRYAITERLSASVGGGLRVRGYDPNGVDVSGKADRFGYYGSIGLTFTF